MEPSYSLQNHIFNHLSTAVYRDINFYNPLNITHPPHSPFLDPLYVSPTGDNKTSSIDLIIPQDCGGFNLGSFFARRTPWIDRLLDIWWDPVLYEQKHMQWEHKEQDALEHLYTNQPWVRTRVAFIEQRKINSFPPGACRDEKAEERRRVELEKARNQQKKTTTAAGEEDDLFGDPVDDDDGDEELLLDPRFHYHARDRDFVVNMAGCEWGRDCWAEMYRYRELSKKLNRGWRERWGDWWEGSWKTFKPELVTKEKTVG